jgi:hypothetical protein
VGNAVEFTIGVDIDAPPERVWAVMSDVERWHEWTPSVTRIKLLDKPFAVGSRALIRQPKFPPALWKVSSLEPVRGFTWTNGLPGLRVFAHHSVEASDRGTRAALRLRYEGPLGRLLARMTTGITNKYLEYEANGLKARSEMKI